MQIDKIIRREVISLTISIILILIMFIGVSYSSFLTVDESENENVISIGDIAFSFCRDVSCNSSITNYGQKIGFQTVDGVTSAMDIFPYTSATEALSQTPYIFNIKNTGTLDMYIDISLKEDDSFMPEGSYASYTKTTEIYANNIKVGISRCDNDTINRTNVIISSYGSLEENKILQKQLLKEGESNTYCVWTWLDENTPNEVQKTYFVADLSVKGEYLPSGYMARTCENQMIANCFKNNYSIYGMNSITQASTGNQNYATTEYRYQGSNPKNYIKFNNELWRIVGVFEVQTPIRDASGSVTNYTKEYKMKIVRNDSLGTLYYNKTKTSTNYSDWNTSTLQKLLNTGAYYNRTTAYSADNCSSNNASCNYSSNGLTSEAKNLVTETKWYLGNVTGGKTLSETYKAERSVSIHTGNSQIWNGKVALIYPSDYMYASSTNYTSSTLSSNTSWKNNNWLFTSADSWSLSPRSDNASYISTFVADGNINYSNANALVNTRPALYLSSSAILKGNGDGSLEHPFEIGLE